MTDRLNTEILRTALRNKGWQQNDLATALDVTEAAVSQWMSGTTAPRPATLVRLANLFDLGIVDLLTSEESTPPPLVAYRRKGQQQTSEFNEDEALDQAFALDSMADLLPPRTLLPPSLIGAVPTYSFAETAAAEVRAKLGVASGTPVTWEDLLRWFTEWHTNVVPVFWGQREHHGNALHIYLPRTQHTFVFINLDSERLDFKFWLAHELAHALTPQLVGQEEGEDLADLFAGSLLFPKEQAAGAYRDAIGESSPSRAMTRLSQWATEWGVSIYTVYRQCNQLAEDRQVPQLKLNERSLHASRRKLDQTTSRIGYEFFSELPPRADDYLKLASERFGSAFFDALHQHLVSHGDGARFVRRCMHMNMHDATAFHAALAQRTAA